jgi:hypothetical protein
VSAMLPRSDRFGEPVGPGTTIPDAARKGGFVWMNAGVGPRLPTGRPGARPC